MAILKLKLYGLFCYCAFAVSIAMEADKNEALSSATPQAAGLVEDEYFGEEDNVFPSLDFDPTTDIAPGSLYKHQKSIISSTDFDEGWRWRKNLILQYDDFIYDFNQVHHDMAFKESSISSQLREDTTKANIAIAMFHFIVENAGVKKVIAVPLYVDEGKEAPTEIIFRSGRLAKDKPLFKPDAELEIRNKYYIYPPSEPTTADNELPFQVNINKISLIEAAVETNNTEEAMKLLKNMRVSLEERLAKKKKNDDHMERLQHEIKERFNINGSTSITNSIIGNQIYKRIKESPWSNPKRLQELYLHSEQNMLLYFKDNLVKIIESNFSEVLKTIIPSLETLKDTDPQQLKIGKIHGIILNLHSRLDICDRCAPSIARECERSDSFVADLKAWIPNYLKSENEKLSKLGLGEKEYDPEAPFFAVFSSVRQELSNQERRFKCGHDKKYEGAIDVKNLYPYFVTKIIEPFKLKDTEYLANVG